LSVLSQPAQNVGCALQEILWNFMFFFWFVPSFNCQRNLFMHVAHVIQLSTCYPYNMYIQLLYSTKCRTHKTTQTINIKSNVCIILCNVSFNWIGLKVEIAHHINLHLKISSKFPHLTKTHSWCFFLIKLINIIYVLD